MLIPGFNAASIETPYGLLDLQFLAFNCKSSMVSEPPLSKKKENTEGYDSNFQGVPTCR
jgi:hypothetical protein